MLFAAMQPTSRLQAAPSQGVYETKYTDMHNTETGSDVSKKGAKTVRIKTTLVEKKGFTVALVAMADGSKLPVVIIFKEHGRVLGE